MAGAFRYKVWDPPLIVSQIITVQALYYLGLCTWISILELFAGYHRTLDSVFDFEELQIKQNHGRFIMVAFVLNSLTSGAALWQVVQRTKQCLDFSATVHILHLIICWGYVGYLPTLPSFYLLHTLCLALMCVLAEYLCLRSEMTHIPVRTGPLRGE